MTKRQIKGAPLGHCLLSTTHLARQAERGGKPAKGPVLVRTGDADSGRAGAGQPGLGRRECRLCPLAQQALRNGGAWIKARPARGSRKHCSDRLLLGEQGKSASASPPAAGPCASAWAAAIYGSLASHSVPSCRAPSNPARWLATTCARRKPASPSPSPSLRAATSCARGSAPTRRPSSSRPPLSSPSPAPSSAPSPSKPWWAPPEHPPLGAPWGWGASTARGPPRARGASAPLAGPTLLPPAAPTSCRATARSCGTPVGPAKATPCPRPPASCRNAWLSSWARGAEEC